MDAEARDRVALVTGAGSPTGIGFASASVLGREGARLAITSTSERIHDRAAELTALGYDAAGFVADLTDREQVRALVDAVVETFGRIDILVNNAGMVNVAMDGPLGGDFITLSDADWDLDISLNLQTAFNVSRAVVPGMTEPSGSVTVPKSCPVDESDCANRVCGANATSASAKIPVISR